MLSGPTFVADRIHHEVDTEPLYDSRFHDLLSPRNSLVVR